MAAKAKAAEQTKREAGMKIASLEMKIAQDNLNDITPKPKATSSHRLQSLWQTSSHLILPLHYNNGDHDLNKPLTKLTIDGTEDEYQHPTDI